MTNMLFINLSEVIGILLIIFQLIMSPYIQESFRRVAFHILFALYTIYIYALSKGILSKILSSQIIEKLGSYSFYFYIAHVICLRYLYNVLELLPINMEIWHSWKGWIPVLICWAILVISGPVFIKILKKVNIFIKNNF